MTLEELEEILKKDKPSDYLKKYENELFELIPDLRKCKGFNQNNPWHPYTVLEHIFNVVDNVSNEPDLRLAALFHDIGKASNGIYQVDENGIGHFYNHWIESQKIFLDFANRNNLEPNRLELISKLIFYHDKSINNESDLTIILNNFTKEEAIMLFKLKKADIAAQNQELVKLHDLDNKYNNSENELLNRYSNRK